MKVYTLDAVKQDRLESARQILFAPVFGGDMRSNLSGVAGPARYFEDDPKKSSQQLRAELNELRHRISMAAQPPSLAEIEAFFGKFYIDVTRRANEAPDLTDLIAAETVNFEFPETVNLRDVEKYRGEFGLISGTNDAVPLIEQNTGNVDTVTIAIKALGWKSSLKNILFNKFFTYDKVVQAAIDADVDERNAQSAGVMINATYDDSQTQTAASSGTLDEKTYQTILDAIKKLRALKDIQTRRVISAPRIRILCNSANTWQIENVVRGQLNGNGTGVKTANRPALPIDAIIEYDQGINHGFTWGKKTLNFPGVPVNTIFLFVPDVLMVATKRPLTLETGEGATLQLSTQEYAWYRAQGVYSKVFLGSSYPGTSEGDGFGYTVKATLPTS